MRTLVTTDGLGDLEKRGEKGRLWGYKRQTGFRRRAGGQRKWSASGLWMEPLTLRPQCNTTLPAIRMASIKIFFKKGGKK